MLVLESDRDLAESVNRSEEKGRKLSKYICYGDSSKDCYNLKRNILICNTCYWSTSLICTYDAITSCPICKNYKLETIPININESYTYYYDLKKGLVLNFTKHKNDNNGHN